MLNRLNSFFFTGVLIFSVLASGLGAQQVFDFTGEADDGQWSSQPSDSETEGIVIEDSALEAEPVTSPGQVTVFDREAIRASGAGTVADVVERAPGVVVSRQGGILEPRRISIRGGESGHVLVLIDGKPADSLWSGEADLGGMSLSGIERIEVIRGAAAAIYGEGAVSGVINIITREAEPEPASMRIGYGIASFNTHKLSGSLSGALSPDSAWSGGIRADGLYTGGDYGYQAGEEARTRLNNDGWAADGSAGLSWSGEDSVMNLSVDGAASERGIPGLMEFLTPEARSLNIKAGSGINFSLEQSTVGDLDFSGDYSYRFSRFTNPDRNIDDLNDDNSVSVSAGWSSDIEAGELAVSLSADSAYLFDYLYSTALTDSSGSSVGGTALRHEIDLRLRSDLIAGCFDFIPAAGISWALNDYAAAGASTDTGIVWSVAAGWAPFRTGYEEGPVYLKINAGTAWKNPSFRDLFWPSGALAAGNPDLLPERSFNIDAGLFCSTSDEDESGISAGLEAVGFFSTAEDLIQWLPSAGGIWRPVNIGLVHHFGAELSGNLSFDSLPDESVLSIALTYNWLKSIDADVSSVNFSRQLAYRPEHSGDLSVMYRIPGTLSLEAGCNYLGYRFTNNSNTRLIDQVFLLSAALNYEVCSAFSLSCSADNLLNLEYIDRLGYPVPGLEWSLKGEFSL